MKSSLQLKDISRKGTEPIVSIGMDEIMDVPVLDVHKIPWQPLSEDLKDKYCCNLDDLVVLQIPRPKTPREEEELVNKFLDGMRKLFSADDNWPFLAMLDTTMDYCVQCNSCSEACHLFEATKGNEMYRPNFRTEIFRRIYKQYIKKEPFSKWRYGDLGLNWETVARLGELAYRCNLCRRCAQVCPIGIDNGLVARELRKLFSQEMGIYPPELHDKGTMNQLRTGSSTGMDPIVVKENVQFIDEDFSESTGYEFQTPWDVEGADILLIHNAGEVMAWPENIAAFSIIFQAAGLSWTLSSEITAYDSVNYGLFYDDFQLARIALLQAQAAKKLGVKRIVVAECGHAHKALTVIADRVLPAELSTPRESCLPILRDAVMSGKITFDPSRNDFPVTLHDPCNVVRLMGVVQPQREILRKICPQFREMTPHGVENYCCGGGSGFAIMSRNNIEPWRNNITGRKKIAQIAEAFADCPEPEVKKYVCAPCSNCKGQIRELIAHNGLLEKNSIHYGGIVELIVNAMADVNPGFINWGEEE